MRKILFVLLGLCTAYPFVSLNGCGDTFITNNNGITPTAAAHLDQGYMYIATQNTGYSEGAAFWMDNAGNIQSDLGGQNVLSYKNDEDNANVVIFTVLLPWYNNDTLRFITRKSPFKYDQIPAPGNSTYPFRGVGIVNAMNYFFAYDQENSIIHLFNVFNGNTWSLSAVYDGEKVVIDGGIQLVHNSVVPDPLQTNVHEWLDPDYHGWNIQVTAYRLFWLGSDGKIIANPGKVIKSK